MLHSFAMTFAAVTLQLQLPTRTSELSDPMQR
jgi:hypothetical protein